MRGNTMSKIEYIKEHMLWMLFSSFFCLKIIFRCISGCTLLQSWMILGGVFVVTSVISILLTIKRNRNAWNIGINIILIWGIYIVIAYLEFFREKMILVAKIALTFSVINLFLILFRRIKIPENKRKIIKIRIYRCIESLRRNIAVALVIIMVPIAIHMITSDSVITSEMCLVKPTYGDEYSLSANIEQLANLKQERFEKLTLDEKLALCKTICMVEARYFGVSNEVNVAASTMSDGILAYYNEQLHLININIEHLQSDSSYDVLRTLLHESYHMYQYALIESYYNADEKTRNLLLYYDVGVYIEELEDYKSGGSGSMFELVEYSLQWLELDAEHYAEEAVDEYYEKIEEYLKEQG